MQHGPAKPGRIPSLDGLRGVSICLVVAGHASGTVAAASGWPMEYLGYLADTGVQIFLVLSGYLISRLLLEENRAKGRIDLRGFYTRRVLRIFPVFYSYLIVLSLLMAAGLAAVRPDQIVNAGLFLQNYCHFWTHYSYNESWFVAHFCTLALEEQFYLFWPASLCLLGRRRAMGLAAALFLSTPFIRVANFKLHPAAGEHLAVMWHTASDPIMFGSLLALAEGGKRFEDIHSRLSRPWVFAAAVLFISCVSPALATTLRGAYFFTIGITLNALAIGFILLHVSRNPVGVAGRFLNHPAARHVGVISYSLYVWQQWFLTPLNVTILGRFPLNILAAFAVAELSYRLIERPVQSWRARRKTGNQANPEEVGPVPASCVHDVVR